MSLAAFAPLLAMLFVEPLTLPPAARMWTLLPLVACVAVVYRATRVRHAHEITRGAIRSFLSIVVGMVLIAAGFYAVHQLVLYWS